MDDLALRNLVYRRFVELGRAPTMAELATTEEALGRLHERHLVVLEPDRSEIRMAIPFSAVPTPYRVEAGGRSWFANCAWDAFGILAALGVDGRISSSCPDCGEPIALEIAAEQPDDPSLLFHCLVPAARWWDDIVFT